MLNLHISVNLIIDNFLNFTIVETINFKHPNTTFYFDSQRH